MDELLAAILGAIAEFLLEAFLELIAAAVLDLTSRALLGLFTNLAEAIKGSGVLSGFMYTLLGVLAGALSLCCPPTSSHPSRAPNQISRYQLVSQPYHHRACLVISWSRHAEMGKEGDSR